MKTVRALVFFLLATVLVHTVEAASMSSFMGPFRRLAILDQGRIKPVDTFARGLLKQFSGRSSLAGMDASSWLARVFFTPWETHDDPVFLVSHPDVLSAIGLPGKPHDRYSFRQLHPCLDSLQKLAYQASVRTGDKGDSVETELMRLFNNVSAYYRLARTFHFVWSGLPGDARAQGQGDNPALIPLNETNVGTWLNPGQAYALGEQLPAPIRKELSLLLSAAKAGSEHRWQYCATVLNDFNRSLQDRRPDIALLAGKIDLEVFFNRFAPLAKAQLAYGLTLLFFFLSWTVWGLWARRLGLLFLAAGLGMHLAGMAMRMLITARPPVTNLYETFVFVGWIGVVMGFALEIFHKKALGILCGGLAGGIFLTLAGHFAAEGDTMGMLAAVLDSNMWLTVHVVTISMGYAGCVVAGIIGHWGLIQRLQPRQDSDIETSRTTKALLATLAFGLVFTCIGTVMGGLWADQSWGRFWGWDPKENGALLIILWCAALLHSRQTGWIGPLGLAAGAVGAIITVAMAWLGVNLLGLGMHAYGFTSGISRGSIGFIAAELLFITVTLIWIRKKKRDRIDNADLKI